MAKTRLYTVLIAAFAVTSLVVENADASYTAISYYLVEKVNGKKVESNMKAAVQWLKELEATKSRFFSNGPVKDLKKFTALQQVIEDTKCDQSAFRVLRENEQELVYGSVMRIDLILNQIFLDHSKKCSEIYPTVFKTKKEQFGSDFEYVKNIGDRIMQADEDQAKKELDIELGDNFYDLDIIISYYITGAFSITRHDYSSYLYRALKANSNGNVNAKYLSKQVNEKTGSALIAKVKVKELAKELLVKPCKDYVNMFGPDLFVPARFDAKYYQAEEVDKFDFYYGNAYYAMCKSLVDKELVVIYGIIKYMNRNRLSSS